MITLMQAVGTQLERLAVIMLLYLIGSMTYDAGFSITSIFCCKQAGFC
jgi:hypothetical protein